MSDRRIPLSAVTFNGPTAIPEAPTMLVSVEAGKDRGSTGFKCPQPFYDPELRVVVIGGRMFPIDRVHWMERAKMALGPVSEVDAPRKPQKTKSEQ